MPLADRTAVVASIGSEPEANRGPTMRLLLLSGTGLLGPFVPHQVVEAGHAMAVFHRGQTRTELPSSVVHILGDRKNSSAFAPVC